MNITSLTVTNPRANGEYRDPYITLTVDESVMEMDDVIYAENTVLRIVPCGMFYAIEKPEPVNQSWVDCPEAVGRINTLDLVKHQLISVVVESPDQSLDIAMPVSRLRRLIRNKTPRI